MTFDNIQHTTYNDSMIRTQVYLPEDIYEDLKLLARSGKVNFSQLLREGASEVIKKKKKAKGKFDPWREFVGAGGKGGPKDLSSKIDYYLYVKPYENKKK